MEDWKKRMINEERQLKTKIDKLCCFLRVAENGSNTVDIDSENLLLMYEQLDAMVRYHTILKKRMELYNLIIES